MGEGGVVDKEPSNAGAEQFGWVEEFVREVSASVAASLGDRVAQTFAKGFADTLTQTITWQEDGTAFVVTGDIPAMWLRDSTTQMSPYLRFCQDWPQVERVLAAVNKRQLAFLKEDPYANAFNAAGSSAGHHDDLTDMKPIVWERKYEIDSLAYPLSLAHDLYFATGNLGYLQGEYLDALQTAIDLWRIEQQHEEKSPYRFERPAYPLDSLARAGLGTPVGITGMTWAGFRPSDDPTVYGYNVPGNAFAASVLETAATLCREQLAQMKLGKACESLAAEIRTGIEEYGTVTHPKFGKMYAYEVDGLGNYLLMDDANVPSLLSLPLLGWCEVADSIYQATRSFVLSSENPYFVSGKWARGVGSPHTPAGYVWPIAIAVQGITGTDEEAQECLEVLTDTTAGTMMMHESFDVNDPAKYTRPWFSWANAMYARLVFHVIDTKSALKTI